MLAIAFAAPLFIIGFLIRVAGNRNYYVEYRESVSVFKMLVEFKIIS
jgi:hypothetical protein